MCTFIFKKEKLLKFEENGKIIIRIYRINNLC
jgi:hypothetical protein